MSIRPPSPAPLGLVAIGVALGWLASGPGRAPEVRADGLPAASPPPLASAADGGRGQVMAGPIRLVRNPAVNVPVPQDAVYFLDHAGARLMAAVPTSPSTGATNGEARITTEFVERDLAADFPVPAGVEAHFAMTVARMGASNEGWAPLFVFETKTAQVAIYRLNTEMKGRTTLPKIELLERKSLAKTALPPISR